MPRRRRVVQVSTVLLAEDDPAIADPLSRALQREGYEVRIVGDGPSVLKAVGLNSVGAKTDGLKTEDELADSAHIAELGAISEQRIDLVVLDLGLPGMDGLEVCRRLRTSGTELPVLMLTARADEVDFVVGLDEGLLGSVGGVLYPTSCREDHDVDRPGVLRAKERLELVIPRLASIRHPDLTHHRSRVGWASTDNHPPTSGAGGLYQEPGLNAQEIHSGVKNV